MPRLILIPFFQYRVFLILLIQFCLYDATGQLNKLWELSAAGEATYPISYDVNHSPVLKSFRMEDGGFIALGRVKDGPDYLNSTIYLFKYDSEGNIIWEFLYDSPYGLNEFVYDITMDIFGNIILAAKTTTYYSGGFELEEKSNALLLKISTQGVLVWSWESDNPANNIIDVQQCSAVTTDKAGNIFAACSLITETGYKSVLQKWSQAGQLIWEQPLDHNSIKSLTIINNILVIIYTGSHSFLQHYSMEGTLLFSTEVPKIVGIKPVFDTDGNLYILSIQSKYKIVKLDLYGDSLWAYHKPTNLPPNVSADELIDCVVAENGDVYVTGRYYGPYYGDTLLYTNCDILTAKLDAQGNVVWENIYRFDNKRSCQIGARILVDSHGNSYVAGYQSVKIGSDPFGSTDMVILVYDHDGNRIDSVYYDGLAHGDDNGVNMMLDSDALYLLGWSQQPDGLFDPVVIKYSNQYTSIQAINNNDIFSVWPNPIKGGHCFIKSDQEIISARIIDLTGRLLYYGTNFSGNPQIDFGLNIHTGIYIITVTTKENVYSKAIVIEDQ